MGGGASVDEGQGPRTKQINCKVPLLVRGTVEGDFMEDFAKLYALGSREIQTLNHAMLILLPKQEDAPSLQSPDYSPMNIIHIFP